MRLRRDQRGFVLSGTGLLLVLPAMLLTVSALNIATMGGEAASLQAAADRVFYTGKDIERVLKDLWDENLLADNEISANATFTELTDNYRAATGLLIDITPSWMLWIHVENTEENHYAGTIYCKLERVSAENWRYWFEDLEEENWGLYPGDPDYDEPVLLLTKLDNGDLRITLEEYEGGYWSDIQYGLPPENTLLWNDVTSGSPSIGENRVVSGTTQLRVSIDVRDSREMVRYSSRVDLG